MKQLCIVAIIISLFIPLNIFAVAFVFMHFFNADGIHLAMATLLTCSIQFLIFACFAKAWAEVEISKQKDKA